ncbi:MAG: DUF4412 domain-containing protein [Bacteroidales bacterium]|nr:DUF4412 domain-containing protein [Bacteroidales bacterium]
MQILRKSLFLLVFLPLTCSLLGQNFEGSITFVKKSFYDTTFHHYYVKNNRIRIDKYEEQGGQLIETLLVDLQEETVTAVNPQKKLYRPLSIAPDKKIPNEDFKVIKTKNFRRINGNKCYQWRVRNRKLNSEIAYWVAPTRFDFYGDLLKLLKRTERAYRFFMQIPDNEGYFPMLSVERTLLRDERERLVVKDIVRDKLSKALFTIPEDYRELLFSQQIQE